MVVGCENSLPWQDYARKAHVSARTASRLVWALQDYEHKLCINSFCIIARARPSHAIASRPWVNSAGRNHHSVALGYLASRCVVRRWLIGRQEAVV